MAIRSNYCQIRPFREAEHTTFRDNLSRGTPALHCPKSIDRQPRTSRQKIRAKSRSPPKSTTNWNAIQQLECHSTNGMPVKPAGRTATTSTRGETRTPNLRIWNPLLCRLSYSGLRNGRHKTGDWKKKPRQERQSFHNLVLESHICLLFTIFFVNRVLPQPRTIFLKLQPIGSSHLFLDTIVAITGFSALQPNVFTGHGTTRREIFAEPLNGQIKPAE